jgi:hypothetical protein
MILKGQGAVMLGKRWIVSTANGVAGGAAHANGGSLLQLADATGAATLRRRRRAATLAAP